MQKRSIMQRASAVALAAAMAITLSVAPTTQANAASKQSVNVITTAKTSGGDTIKYTYNKKGLVKKSVATSSEKDSNSDKSVKTTVTYKYNKKNKITSETKKVVTKDTYYKTDETTGNKRGAKEGQITTTDTTVTKYTYNKKGLATKSVATTTRTKSGSVTTTKQTLGVVNSNFDIDDDYDNKDVDKELEDGSVIAGYNKYNANGTVNNEHTKTNAYYYDNKLASLSTTTTTETYSAGKDGTYTYTNTINTTGSYKTEYDETHYGYVTINGAETLVTLTPQTKTYEGEEGPYTHTSYVYQDPAGNIYYPNPGSQFTVVNKVNVIASAVPSTSTTVTNDVVSDKSVTTTKYTYDKKKRVKKAVSTTVDSSTKANTYNSSSSSATRKSEKATKEDSTSENTSTVTIKYTYDKKGRVKKTVYTDPGKDTYKSTTSYMKIKDYSQDYNDLGVATRIRNHDYTCAAGYTDVTNISVENNVRTVTKTKNQYSDTYTVLGYDSSDDLSGYGYNAYEKSTVTGTKSYTFYGNGGSQIEDKFTESGIGSKYDYVSDTYTDAPFTKIGTVNRHKFDKNGTTNGTIYTYEKYNADGSLAYKDSGADYYNGIKYTWGDEATVALAPAIATNASNGTVYNYVTTVTEPATPVKETTKYVYDKTGNVKTANVKGTSTSVYNVVNESYGNAIYKFDGAGKLQEVKTTYTNKYTNKKSNENTVKTGTKNLTKVLKTSKGKYNMSSSSGYNLDSRIIYTLKGKKYASSNAKLVKKQQWMIQNGRLNGVVGLY